MPTITIKLGDVVLVEQSFDLAPHEVRERLVSFLRKGRVSEVLHELGYAVK